MGKAVGIASGRDGLLQAVSGARNRWRLRAGLRGAAIAVAIVALVIIAAAFGMEQLRFSQSSVTVLRLLAYVAGAITAAFFLVLPLARPVPDERVALYLEERDPSLDAVVLSAVEQSARTQDTPARSPALVGRLVESAVERVQTARAADAGERRDTAAAAATLAAIVFAVVALFAFGPAFLRHGARLVLTPWSSADAAPVYAIDVAPGNTTIGRGGDQQVSAHLRGFQAEEVMLAVRRGEAGQWEQVAMGRGADSGSYVFRLFDLDAHTQYFVEANGVRSPVFRIAVADLPQVRRVDLEYRYPAYTGLAPQREEDGGDIAAVRGTTVLITAFPTSPARGGRIVVEGRDTIPLTLADSGTLVGRLTVQRSGYYKIELHGAERGMVPASLDYTIDALADDAPTVRLTEPGRDTKVSALDEVFTEAKAEDDFGVARLELVYSVNGAAEKTVVLQQAGRRATREVTAGQTLFLEEFGLAPGDVVSYYARATDADPQGAKTATTDIYFLSVRPFGQEYRQAEQQGGGNGEAEQTPNALSQRQREIVAATFKTIRDRATTAPGDLRENVATIHLSQGRLREQVETLAQRMTQRGLIGIDSSYAAVAAELPEAAREMRAAEERLAARDVQGALPHEQRALQHLQRAEAAFREVQVSFGGDPGAGSGPQPTAEDLAELFEIEKGQVRNRYETVERARARAESEQVDETLERLRQLAARQQQENERMRRKASELQGGGGSAGGDSQRQLAAEAEELARRLERLSRENASEDLRQTARELREAASEMRRAASRGNRGEGQGSSALQRLEEARRRLDDSRASRLEDDARDAVRRADALRDRQRAIGSAVERLKPAAEGRAETERVLREKEALAKDIDELEAKLEQMSREARGDRRDASRKLGAAAAAIRDSRLQDKIRFSRGIVQGGSSEYARNFEGEIGASIEGVRQKVADAAAAVREPKERHTARTLEKTRDLVRGLESLDERIRQGRGARGEGREGEAKGKGQGQEQGEGQGKGQGQGQGQGQTPGGGSARGGSTAGGVGGAMSPEAARQYAREFRERRRAAEALRRELAAEGAGTADLERLLGQMRALEGQGIYDDPEELERLQASVIEGFKAFEFALRRRAEGATASRPLLGGSDDLPAGFRQLVEEYYRSLARTAPR